MTKSCVCWCSCPSWNSTHSSLQLTLHVCTVLLVDFFFTDFFFVIPCIFENLLCFSLTILWLRVSFSIYHILRSFSLQCSLSTVCFIIQVNNSSDSSPASLLRHLPGRVGYHSVPKFLLSSVHLLSPSSTVLYHLLPSQFCTPCSMFPSLCTA